MWWILTTCIHARQRGLMHVVHYRHGLDSYCTCTSLTVGRIRQILCSCALCREPKDSKLFILCFGRIWYVVFLWCFTSTAAAGHPVQWLHAWASWLLFIHRIDTRYETEINGGEMSNLAGEVSNLASAVKKHTATYWNTSDMTDTMSFTLLYSWYSCNSVPQALW